MLVEHVEEKSQILNQFFTLKVLLLLLLLVNFAFYIRQQLLEEGPSMVQLNYQSI